MRQHLGSHRTAVRHPKGQLRRLKPWFTGLTAAIAFSIASSMSHAAPSQLFATSGYAPREFAIIKADSWYHVYMTRVRLPEGTFHHDETNKFEHWVSQDLHTWTFVDADFTTSSNPASFDHDHIWSPHITFHNGTYYMYYTGVRDDPTTGEPMQSLGVATTTQLSTVLGGTVWQRSSTPMYSCAPGWRDCAPGDFRDLFVMRSTYLWDDSGWLGYYVTQIDPAMVAPPAEPENYVVGMIRAQLDQPTQWTDRGPIMSTTYDYQPPSMPRSYFHESPHLIHHGSTWYMFFTSRPFTDGIKRLRYLTGPSAIGDLFLYHEDWTYQGVEPNVHPWAFASETFTDVFTDGQDDYFCYVRPDSVPENQRLEFAQIKWPPDGQAPYELIDPLRVYPLSVSVPGGTFPTIMEGEEVYVFVSGHNLQGDPNHRSGHFDVYELDNDVRTPIAPSSIGLPNRVDDLVAAGGQFVLFNCRFFWDDDDTPDELEIVIACRGKESQQFTIRRPPNPGSLRLPDPTYRPKDFAIIKVDSLYHAFYIMSNGSQPYGEERMFGHATSPDLRLWRFRAETFFARSGSEDAFDRDHVWAPSIVEKDGTFHMFYTGVRNEAVRIQTMGVASTTDRDLMSWPDSDRHQAFECGQVDWANCAPGDFRDPFVMPSSGFAGDPGWLMYYVTHPDGVDPPSDYLVGVAHAGAGSVTNWADFGPVSDTHPLSHLIESPHVIYGGTSLYYLFFTDDDGGIQYVISGSPAQSFWIPGGTMFEGDNSYTASEAFTAIYPDGTREDFFGAVYDENGVFSNPLLFSQIQWGPGLAVKLFDPLDLTLLSASSASPTIVPEGSAVTLAFTTSHGDNRTRRAPIEVFEDDNGTRRSITPASVGLPATIALNQQVQTYTFNILSDYPENDGTNSRAEVVIRVKGKEFPLIYVGRDGTPPAAITNLGATMYLDGADLHWTAPGDDGSSGTATAYDLRYSQSPITAANFGSALPIWTDEPHPAGTPETACVDVLHPCTYYYFAIKTVDERYNWSGLSNVPHPKTKCSGQSLAGCGYGSAAHRQGDEPSAQSLVLDFGDPAPNPAVDATRVEYSVPSYLHGGRLELSLFDLEGRLVRTLARGAAEQGRHTASWDLRDSHGRIVGHGIYFLRMTIGSEEKTHRILVVKR